MGSIFFSFLNTMNHSTLITSQGLTQLKTELADLNGSKRPSIVERLSIARSMGDLSENSDYQSAKEELSFTDGRIAELEEIVTNAKTIVPTQSNTVDFGHMVTVQVGSTKVVFHIVGEWEADPSKKKISHSSPLGKALIGKKVGEKVEVEAPVGKVQYTIVGIE